MIIFIQHALLKLKQRKISKDEVIKTLNFPDHITSSYSGRKIENENIVVITQYWTKLIK